MVFVNLLDNRVGYLRHSFHAAFEQLQSLFEQPVGQFVGFYRLIFIFRERRFHCECLEQFQLEAFIVDFRMLVYNGTGCIVNRIQHVQADTFSHQGVTAAGVDYVTLRVHHIVVFQQTLTDTEVVFFHLFLCTFYGLAQHAVFQYFAFLEA